MICRFCGVEIPENDRFCSNCGAEVAVQHLVSETPAEKNEQTGNGASNQTNTPYGNNGEQQNGYFYGGQNPGGFYAGTPAGAPQGYWVPPVNDKAPTLKDYLKWMLLYPLLNFIPGIGFIVYIVFCIKYALDNTFTARANYFKAVLVAQIIGIVIAAFIFIFMFGFLGFFVDSVFTGLEELDPSFFMDEGFFMEEFNQFIRIFAK